MMDAPWRALSQWPVRVMTALATKQMSGTVHSEAVRAASAIAELSRIG